MQGAAKNKNHDWNAIYIIYNLPVFSFKLITYFFLHFIIYWYVLGNTFWNRCTYMKFTV